MTAILVGGFPMIGGAVLFIVGVIRLVIPAHAYLTEVLPPGYLEAGASAIAGVVLFMVGSMVFDRLKYG